MFIDTAIFYPIQRTNCLRIDVIADCLEEYKYVTVKSKINCIYFIRFDKWDNKFFGIGDTEAGWINPQTALTLEVTHSALENGGFTLQKLKGSNTGVYIGMNSIAISIDKILGTNQQFILN